MKTVSSFPTLLESFFIESLIQQQQASPHTLASYRDTFLACSCSMRSRGCVRRLRI
jgi:hypothetical protein